MKTFIVDTSVVAKLFLDESDQEFAIRLFELSRERQCKLLAPNLILYEIHNVLVKQNALFTRISEALYLFEKQIKNNIIN